MIQSLRNEAKKSEDTFAQLQEIQESIRLAFLNCFLDFAGMLDELVYCYVWGLVFLLQLCPVTKLPSVIDFPGNLERIVNDIKQYTPNTEGSLLPNGYSHESEENLSFDLHGGVTDPHKQLLIVLSNIGYCKDELSYELYGKYEHVWLHSRYVVFIVLFYILISASKF